MGEGRNRELTIPTFSATVKQWLAAGALLGFPAAVAMYFIYLFALPTPITDEWMFVRGVMRASQATSLSELWQAIPKQHHGHPILVAFLVYWPLEVLTHFDSRALIGVTLACFAAQVAIFRAFIVRSTLAAFPIAVLYFSPSHFFEFVWGHMFHVSLSILLSVLGLLALDRVSDIDSVARLWGKLSGATMLFVLASLCSAGGFLGFPAGAVLLVVKAVDWNKRLKGVLILLLAAGLLYLGMLREEAELRIGVQPFLGWLTGFGAAVWGSPVVMLQFKPDLLSLTGAAILAIAAVLSVFATSKGVLHRIALPLGLITYSALAMATVQVIRGGFANWHVQFVLPGVAATYAAACILSQWMPSARLMAALIASALASGVVTYFDAFHRDGPWWHRRGKNIEAYILTYEERPDQPRPFPNVVPIDLQLIAFLKAQGHVLFR